ncbi:PaaI family thioesterase [uncultured Roseobacter sp.]|uniref:PaaI family thioesterase n=1 Tax=uncultured Roseobacter sp. TaxID=114847 RepID=UPI0026145607|nr:PaaI family thioesterase [uncultured Roseobacter sp.]
MPLPPPETLILDETGTQRLAGYAIDVSDPASAHCWLDIGPQHLNRHAVLHGGIATMLLDSACGATASLTVDHTGKAPFLTVSLNTQFLAPARSGRVTARGQIAGGGRKLLFVSGALTDAEGGLIATATGVFRRVPQERLA